MASWVSGTPNDYLKQCAMTLFSQFYMDRWVEDLPDGWSYQRVEEFAEKVAMGPFGSNIKVETFVDEGVPIISSAHLRGLLLEELEYSTLQRSMLIGLLIQWSILVISSSPMQATLAKRLLSPNGQPNRNT